MCPNDFLKEKKTFSSSKLTDFFSSLLRLAFTSSSSATGITRARFCVSACRCYHFLLPSCREMSEIMISAVTSRNIGHCHPSYKVKKKKEQVFVFSDKIRLNFSRLFVQTTPSRYGFVRIRQVQRFVDVLAVWGDVWCLSFSHMLTKLARRKRESSALVYAENKWRQRAKLLPCSCEMFEARRNGQAEEKKTTRSGRRRRITRRWKRRRRRDSVREGQKKRSRATTQEFSPLAGKALTWRVTSRHFEWVLQLTRAGASIRGDFSTKMAPIETADEVSARVSSVAIDWCAKLAQTRPIKGVKLIKWQQVCGGCLLLVPAVACRGRE